MKTTIDAKAAIDRLMRFLAVEGVTGQERTSAVRSRPHSRKPASRQTSASTTPTNASPSRPRPAT